MDVVIIIGGQAVGKMTVGEELAKLTDLKLFHNHMSIDFVMNLFEWGTPEARALNSLLRDEVMVKMTTSTNKGMIFTFVWAFDMESDWEYMEHVRGIFKGSNIYYAELVADVETRLERNVTENRLNKKWTKRDTEWSRNDILNTTKNHRVVSKSGEVPYPDYIKIDTNDLTAEETALKIFNHFGLDK